MHVTVTFDVDPNVDLEHIAGDLTALGVPSSERLIRKAAGKLPCHEVTVSLRLDAPAQFAKLAGVLAYGHSPINQ